MMGVPSLHFTLSERKERNALSLEFLKFESEVMEGKHKLGPLAWEVPPEGYPTYPDWKAAKIKATEEKK